MSEENQTGAAGAPESAPQDDAPVERKPEPVRENKNVKQEYDATSDFESLDQMQAGAETLPLLSHSRQYVSEKFDGDSEVERQDTPLARRWHGVFNDGFESLSLGARFEATVGRSVSEFRQYLDTEKGKVGFGSPKFGEDVAKVSGEKAQLRVRALMGMGGLITIPLWHSGFHITIKTPKDSALIELRRRLMEEKINLGRHTHGLAFSNVSSYVSDWLISFILDHVYETTLKNSADLRQKIKTPDLPVLFWGLACAVWPKGFQYVRALATDEGVAEKKVVAGKINVSKLMWVDNTAFTKAQKAHMAVRVSNSVTDEQLQKYQDDFPLFKGRQIEINEYIKINLTVPGADAYVRSGQFWLSQLMQIVEGAFTDERDDADRRNQAIAEHANATIMRQFGHWVESIEVEGSAQTDRETIDGILETLSEDAPARAKFHEEVGKFIDDITVAVIAIPEVSNKGTGLPRFPNLIPLDVISVFFTLLMQRVNQILSR